MDATETQKKTMKTRRIEVRLSDEDLRRLDERARSAGIDRPDCVGLLIRKGLDTPLGPEPPARAVRTIDEIFAPIHQEFDESGMSEEELTRLIEEAREEAWRAKQARGAA